MPKPWDVWKIIKELDLKSLDTPEDVSLSVRYGDGGTRYAFLINNSAATTKRIGHNSW